MGMNYFSLTSHRQVSVCGYTVTNMSAERLKIAGNRYRQARDRMETERQELHCVIRASAGIISEAEIARLTGVQRETVRKALGK